MCFEMMECLEYFLCACSLTCIHPSAIADIAPPQCTPLQKVVQQCVEGRSGPVVLFPEGTTTNGECILKCREGLLDNILQVKDTLRPIVFSYSWSRRNPSLTVDPPVRHVLTMLGNVCVCLCVSHLCRVVILILLIFLFALTRLRCLWCSDVLLHVSLPTVGLSLLFNVSSRTKSQKVCPQFVCCVKAADLGASCLIIRFSFLIS
mgnify:CR=1 FL=1